MYSSSPRLSRLCVRYAISYLEPPPWFASRCQSISIVHQRIIYLPRITIYKSVQGSIIPWETIFSRSYGIIPKVHIPMCDVLMNFARHFLPTPTPETISSHVERTIFVTQRDASQGGVAALGIPEGISMTVACGCTCLCSVCVYVCIRVHVNKYRYNVRVWLEQCLSFFTYVYRKRNPLRSLSPRTRYPLLFDPSPLSPP